MMHMSNFQLNQLYTAIEELGTKFNLLQQSNPECARIAEEMANVCLHLDFLNQFKKQTIMFSTWVSVKAFEIAVENDKYGKINYEIEDVYGGIDKKKFLFKKLHIWLSRYVPDMNCSEQIRFSTRIRNVKELGIMGLPKRVEEFVFDPNNFKITDDSDLIPTEERTPEMHDEDCPNYNTDNWDDCNCSDGLELYMGTAEYGHDFWWQEFDYKITELLKNLPDAEFK